MTQRPILILLATCMLCACGKVSTLGRGKDSSHNGAQTSGGSNALGGTSGASTNGVAGSTSESDAGANLGGMGGSPPKDPECLSAVKVEGDLQVSSGSNTTQLVSEVTGDVTIDAATSELPQLRCLETVGNNLDVHIQSGDLSVLSRLRSVHINLTIHGNHDIRELSALSSLTSVGTALTIEDNDALVDLSGLEGLNDDLFELHIRNNPKLENLDALSNLTSRGGKLEISGNDALSDITGLHRISKASKLDISNNPSLRDLAGLEGLTDVSDINIVGNDSLVNLDGLLGVKSANDVSLSDNQALSDLAGLANLATARSIRLVNNVALENIDALRISLTSLRSFELNRSPKVTNVEGLTKLTTLSDGIALSESGVNTLNGLRNLEQVSSLNLSFIKIKDLSGLGKANLSDGYLNLEQNDELLSVSGLSPDNHRLQAAQFRDNAKLDDLSGLSALQSIGILTLTSNPKLESLAGLEGVTTLDTLTLTDSVLTSLVPLDGVQSVNESANIERNANLSNCEALAFVQRTGAPTAAVEGNGPCP